MRTFYKATGRRRALLRSDGFDCECCGLERADEWEGEIGRDEGAMRANGTGVASSGGRRAAGGGRASAHFTMGSVLDVRFTTMILRVLQGIEGGRRVLQGGRRGCK